MFDPNQDVIYEPSLIETSKWAQISEDFMNYMTIGMEWKIKLGRGGGGVVQLK